MTNKEDYITNRVRIELLWGYGRSVIVKNAFPDTRASATKEGEVRPCPLEHLQVPLEDASKRAKKRALISRADIGKLGANIRDGAQAGAERYRAKPAALNLNHET